MTGTDTHLSPFPLGDIDAYRDKTLLYSCFVSRVHYFEEFSAPEYHFLAGKRGSGKSAAVLKLHHDDHDNSILISWRDTAKDHFDYFDAFLAQLIQAREFTFKGIWELLRPSLFFKAAWKYVVNVAVMRHLTQADTFVLDYSDKGTVHSFLRNKGLIDKGPFQVFHGFLKALAPFADLDPRSEQIKSLFSSLEALLNDPEYAKAVDAAQRLTDARDMPLTILIDAILDRVVSNDDLLIASVVALMEAVWELQPYGEKNRVSIKCTIPGEAFERIQHFDILKYSVHTVFTRWSLERLREFIERRLRTLPAATQAPLPTDKEMWSTLFPSELTNRKGYKESSFAYMCRHTHYFPREVLLTTTRLLAFQDNKAMMSGEEFASLVHVACQESAKECLARAERFYGEISSAFAAFVGKSRLLAFSEARSILRKAMGVEKELVWLGVLIEIGVLGVVREGPVIDGRVVASFSHSAKAQPLYNAQSTFAVHPMFYGLLRINTDGEGYVWPEPYWDGIEAMPAGVEPAD